MQSYKYSFNTSSTLTFQNQQSLDIVLFLVGSVSWLYVYFHCCCISAKIHFGVLNEVPTRDHA